MIAANENELLIVYENAVEKVTNFFGTLTTKYLGALPGADRVSLARNNASPPHIVCVAAIGTFLLTTTGVPIPYPDDDVGSPVAVYFLDGYFFFVYGDGSCIASKINSTDIDVLDSIKAEAHPDGLKRSIGFGGSLYLCGDYSTEVYVDSANPTAFPFSRSNVIDKGLASKWSIAGFEEGFGHALVFAASDGIVYQMVDGAPVRRSSFEVEHAISALPGKSELRAFVFIASGHPIWCLKSNSWAWCFDLLTTTWHERTTLERMTWRPEMSIYMFGQWILADEESNALYTPDPGYSYDDNEHMEWLVESLNPGTFPDRALVSRVDFDFVAGTGKAAGSYPVETDPRVWISWSNDGGETWGYPVQRLLGAQGKTFTRVSMMPCGQARGHGRRWRLRVTDPVYVGLLGGTMEVEDLTA